MQHDRRAKERADHLENFITYAPMSVVPGALVLSIVAAAADSHALQPVPPDTEIYLATLSSREERLVIGSPVNISNSAGYDNQPAFTEDGKTILFTSARGGTSKSGSSRPTPTDIYAYDIGSAMVRRITATPEGEYSPTLTPDGRHISVVRVEADGTQRLWRFTREGRDPSLVLPDIKPVGYHAWVDQRRLALFVLGEPPTLQLTSTSGEASVMAKGIGRSILRIPGGGVSYVQVEGGTEEARRLTVMELDPDTRLTRPLVAAVAGAAEADLAWMRDGTLLMAHAGTLYSWRRGRTGWVAAADLAALGLRNVSRIAVSPAGDRISIVAQPQTR